MSLFNLISGNSFPSIRVRENVITGFFVATAVIKVVKAFPPFPSVPDTVRASAPDNVRVGGLWMEVMDGNF